MQALRGGHLMTADLLRLRPYQAKALDMIVDHLPYGPDDDRTPRRIADITQLVSDCEHELYAVGTCRTPRCPNYYLRSVA